MGKSVAPISTCGGCGAAPSSIRKSGVEVPWLADYDHPTPTETPSPTQELEVVWLVTLAPGFLGVTACLRSNSLEEVPKGPSGPLVVGVMTAPGVATMSTSCIIRDEVTGATYLDMVTTSVGRVALSGPESETPAQGPIIEDMTDLVWRVKKYLPLGDRTIPLLLLSGQNMYRLSMGR